MSRFPKLENKLLLVWWVCACQSYWRLKTRKSPSSKFSMLRVLPFLSWSTFNTTRLKADLSAVFSLFSRKSLWSRFWAILVGPRPDHSVIDLTVISTLGPTTLSNFVKTASWTRFSTAVTALLTYFLILITNLPSMIWSWLAMFSPTADFSKRLTGPRVLRFHFQLHQLW